MKTFKPRKIIRLKERDYSRQGYYHVTIRIYNHLEIFGKIENNKMVLNQHRCRGRACPALYQIQKFK